MSPVQDYAGAVRFLREGPRFVVSGHRGPDGDSIGSVLALAGILESMGKEVVRYSCDSMPYPYAFLEGAERFSRQLPLEGDWRAVLVDCSQPERAGNPFSHFADATPLLVVDHHLSDGIRAQVVVSDPEAAAVGLLIDRLATELGVTPSRGVAEAIYTTIISDTGSFHYSNTTPDAMRCCARMLELGVDPWRVATFLYEAEPLARIKLLGDVLETLEVSSDGLCATLLVTRGMLARYNADEDLLDGFINYGRRVQGVEMAVLIREVRADYFKCSMRSRGRVNVAAVAARFGGGGHHNAAGCHLQGDYATVRQTIVAAVREELGRCTAC